MSNINISEIVDKFCLIETRFEAVSLFKNFLINQELIKIKDFLKLFFDELIIKESFYKGNLFLESNKLKNYKNINYHVKQYFFWALLYPNMINDLFNVKENGNIEEKKSPFPSIVSMEYKKISTKDNLGFTHYSYEKPSTKSKLKSGWTYEQSRELTQFLVVGYFNEVIIDKKKLVKIKKNNNQQKKPLNKTIKPKLKK